MHYTECANGHVYDSDQYAVCPYCNNMHTEIQFAPVEPAVMGEGRTVAPGAMGYSPMNPPAWNNQINFMGQPNEMDDFNKTVAPDSFQKRERMENRTVAIFQHEHGMDPVVGWLVCINGSEVGKDYRLRARINSIGRGEENDVCIKGDKTISSRNHAKLAYDSRNNNFMLIQGDGANINYVNGQAIYSPTELHAYDMIDLGETRLLFIPLCNENFHWDSINKKKE